MDKKYDFSQLLDIVRKLRSKDGCPWDKVQTHESLERCMLEEAYEVVEGIHLLKETHDGENLCEELGDVLLQVIFHSQIAEDEGLFTLDDVIEGISEKMVRRHPHVFGDDRTEAGETVRMTWEELKKEERKGKRDQRHELEQVPKALPALIRAGKVQKKSVKGGYQKEESLENVFRHVKDNVEILEDNTLLDEAEAGEIIGNLLYDLCKIAGKYNVYPEEVLQIRTEKEIKKILDVTLQKP